MNSFYLIVGAQTAEYLQRLFYKADLEAYKKLKRKRKNIKRNMELQFEIKNNTYDSDILKLLGDWKALIGDKKDKKESPQPENVELKECVKKFISYYQQGIFNYQDEIHPYLWWISEHVWAFRAHNLNNSFDAVFVDTNNWKATYFYNCKLSHNDSIDYNNESPEELNLTLKYDYFKEL